MKQLRYVFLALNVDNVRLSSCIYGCPLTRTLLSISSQVYADVREASQRPVSRGLLLINYTGQCIFLGLGVARRSRTEMFTNNKGVAVEMSCCPEQRAGPALPPLSGIMSGKFMMQNLPSILVAHVLDPQPGDVIIDLCSAPGGKTSHVASLVKNNATIVACDKSRRKMVSAHKLFEELGATCITPLAWDSTCCVVRDGSERKSVEEVCSDADLSYFTVWLSSYLLTVFFRFYLLLKYRQRMA